MHISSKFEENVLYIWREFRLNLKKNSYKFEENFG